MVILVLAVVMMLSAASAQAQTSTDHRWADWLGCWQIETGREGEALSPADAPRQIRFAPRAPLVTLPDADRPLVCVAPDENGVTMTTSRDAEVQASRTVVADGRARGITDGDCEGTQRTTWSSDGGLLFVHAGLACAGDRRRVTGVTLIGTNGVWVDVRAVESATFNALQVNRYRRVGAQPDTSHRRAPLSLDAVTQAYASVSPRALEAALVETRPVFPLTGRRVLDLADAGLPPGLIDLIVALSFPDRFIVERHTSGNVGPALLQVSGSGAGRAGSVGQPLLLGSPFSYAFTSFDGWWMGTAAEWWGGTGTIATAPVTGTGASRPSGAGRVVNDLGYTRVQPRDADGTMLGLAVFAAIAIEPPSGALE